MTFLKKILAGILLPVGGLFLLMAVLIQFDQSETPKERNDIMLGSLLIGIPTTGLGAWLGLTAQRQEEKKKRDRLNATWFQLIQQNQGTINVLEFSGATSLSAQEAKAYLDQKAKEFTANFEVDAAGNVFYSFPVRNLNAADE
jgi:hypothetical protein